MNAPFASFALVAVLIAAVAGPSAAEISPNMLRNPTFTDGPADARGVPAGWGLYAGAGHDQELRLVDTDKGKALLLSDGDPTAEIGITQTVPAKPGLVYEASVDVRGVPGATTEGSYLQMRFIPSQKLAQVDLAATGTDQFETVSTRMLAPPDTTQITIYLYTHAQLTPKVLMMNARLVSGVEAPFEVPEPVPPVYDKLKDLCTTTDLVKAGQPAAVLVSPASGIYRAQAAAIQQVIQSATGARVPIVTDDSPQAAIPYGGDTDIKSPGLKSNLVIIGNRSTNKTISALYDLYYLLTDLKYPGPEGYEVRSIHNPFGDGHNVLLIGASDPIGIEAGTRDFIAKLGAAQGRQGALSVGWLMDIKSGKGVRPPTELKQFETWEASKGYGSSGYFGWNCISKRMAMYYMTGDAFQAREALRLAFPDAGTIKEIEQTDGEMIENKHDPLAGPYHYNAHMMILFWNLIEASPVFTDEERLRVTNAFSRQLNHRKDEGIYGLTTAPTAVGSRHGQYSAISLYCLGRYFQRYYSAPVWQASVMGAKYSFAPLHKYPNVAGENDNLYWLSTGTAPLLSYMVLSGDRKAQQNGVLATLLRNQEILASGRVPDWVLNYAALDYLNKAAYLTGDGRWLRYRERTGMDTNVFRLGQSFWPAEAVKPHEPTDLVGEWSLNTLCKPMWQERGSGLPFDQSFFFGSYRSAPDASGDFVLLDGFNGASRNPYHTFTVLELRMNGRTLLQGYYNQVLTSADGMVEPKVPMDAALRYSGVVGGTAFAVGEVPDAAYCSWKRTIAHRTGKYSLIVDDLGFHTDSDNVTVQTLWEPVSGSWDAKANALRIGGSGETGLPRGWVSLKAKDAGCTSDITSPKDFFYLDSVDIMLIRATKPGSWIEMPFKLPEKLIGDVFVDLCNYLDRGTVRIYLDGKRIGDDFDHYAATVTSARVPLGRQSLAAGVHKLRVVTIAPHAGSDKCYVGLGGVTIRPEGVTASPAPVTYEMLPADVLMCQPASMTKLEWRGPVKQGQHRVLFSLIAPDTDTPDQRPACVRVADNAAILALPEPALAVVGDYGGTKGDVVVVAADHLTGHAVTASAPLASDTPVDVDWDFASGVLRVVVSKDTQLRLSLTADSRPKLEGKTATGRAEGDGLQVFALTAGAHVFQGVKPNVPTLRPTLTAMLSQALGERAQALAAGPPQSAPIAAKPLATVGTGNIGGKVVDCISITSDNGTLIAAAEGKAVHILSVDGKEVRTLQADGEVRVLRYWPEHKLLLVGCRDEKVLAFDTAAPDWPRKWEFTSVMDPAVYEAAKQYWFKSAPGHEGVHALFTGTFIDGRSQAFVGSACTLEILDENGKLVKRLPIFWGPGHLFQLIDAPDGSRNLLVAREPNDGHALAVVNSKTVTEVARTFDGVPAGHTYVGGWDCMTRDHILYTDLFGDGKREVVSDIDGFWNRVTVWAPDGQPLYNAQFGPGDSMPVRNMRGLDVADLDGDDKQEIVTATSAGLVVALTGKCEKLWSRQMPAAPTVLKCVTPAGAKVPKIVIGCEGGAVYTLDGTGRIIDTGQVTGTPTKLVAVDTANGPVAVFTTDRGEVKGFKVGG